ncbi:single-stranded DNA-binding protein [Spongisporangium articulatum]|uniref:Single-stranded DNA-binding protein n=1 Tax=Spongisporangium articulatum TaxID=3362603 RepID=A0ABW8AKD2_9ACTN
MHDVRVTVRGNITNDLTIRQLDENRQVANFGIACNVRRWDGPTRRFVDQQTLYYRVSCWGRLADNAAASFAKGEPVLVHGKVKQESWEKDGQRFEATTIVAEYIGHDLNWGTSSFRKIARAVPVEAPEDAMDREIAEQAAREREQAGLVVDELTGEVLPADLPDELPDDAWAQVSETVPA